jgi:hypothetical protein
MTMTLKAGDLARHTRTITAIVATAAMLSSPVQPVEAECNPPGADPSFRKAAPYATRILVGEVVAVAPDALNPGDGTSYRFTVAVERTLRGKTTTTLVVDRLRTGACVMWLSAAIGDRIALAMDIREPDPSIARNTAAWIAGTPPPSGYETITLKDVLALARLRVPDTSTAGGGIEDRTAIGIVVAAIGIVVAAIGIVVAVIASAAAILAMRSRTRGGIGPRRSA